MESPLATTTSDSFNLNAPVTHTRLYIDGRWVTSAGGTHPIVSPVTLDTIGRFPETTDDEVSYAVRAATAAFPAWARTPVVERAALLRKLADRLTEQFDDIVSTVVAELGSPRQLAERVHVQLPITVLRTTADLVEEYSFRSEVGNSTVYREPIGVVAAVTPWNYPLHQITAKIVPALAAGCTIVLKPAEQTPLCAFALAKAIHESGFPPGVFNLVTGSGPVVGEALSQHPDVDMVSFTGSVNTGRRVMRDAASNVKRVSLELGGKSASIISEHIDDELLATAVKVSVANCFLNSGQTCSAWTRLLVPEARYAQVRELASAAASKYVPGKRLGPLISEGQRDRVLGYMTEAEDAGVDVIHGGSKAPDLPPTGWFVQPTVYGHVDPYSAVAQEEVFGPVLSVISYSTEAEAIEIANGTRYGLTGAVWATDKEHALDLALQMRTGQVDLNGAQHNPLAPFGGYKQSGTGRELGEAGIEEYLLHKAVQH
jgi:aldehyde dehydrogenase (NAD+)